VVLELAAPQAETEAAAEGLEMEQTRTAQLQEGTETVEAVQELEAT